MSIDIKIDSKSVVDSLENYSKEIGTAIKEELDSSFEKIAEEAKQIHRFRNRTGKLRSAIKSATDQYSAKVFIDDALAPHGKYIHDGFKSWASDPFVVDAFNRNEREIIRSMERVLDDVARKEGLK